MPTHGPEHGAAPKTTLGKSVIKPPSPEVLANIKRAEELKERARIKAETRPERAHAPVSHPETSRSASRAERGGSAGAAHVEAARERATTHAESASGHGDHGHEKKPPPSLLVSGMKAPFLGIGMLWTRVWDTLDGWLKSIEEWGYKQLPKSWQEALSPPRKTAAELKKEKKEKKKGGEKKEEKKEEKHEEPKKEEAPAAGGEHH